MKKLAVPALLVIALMAYYYYLFRMSAVTYIEARALLIPVISIAYAAAAHGVKDSIRACKTVCAKSADAEALRNAGSFLKTAGESTATFTGICVVESVMDMLIKLEDRAGIGPRLAFALIGIIYGTLLYLIILAAHGVVRRNTGAPQRRQENGRHI